MRRKFTKHPISEPTTFELSSLDRKHLLDACEYHVFNLLRAHPDMSVGTCQVLVLSRVIDSIANNKNTKYSPELQEACRNKNTLVVDYVYDYVDSHL